jgi:SAM-dependent methyltransferase
MSETKTRAFRRADFDAAYARMLASCRFFEAGDYYEGHRDRYRRTLEYLCRLPLPSPARVLEIGGGQIALLCEYLFDDNGAIADVSEEYSKPIVDQGVEFVRCDLVRDDIAYRDEFDAVVMCEVVEHLPVPLHIVLEKVKAWVKPGGYLLLTTPNLYRLRNLLRLALGLRVFDFFFYPEQGKSIGHPFEFYREHLAWHLERAGFDVEFIELAQLAGYRSGATLLAKAGRLLAAPLLARPLWRDSLVACVKRPA